MSSAGPLSGVRVVDMTMYVAGPLCTQLLADMGAEVIKTERPPEGDVYRRQGPEFLRDQSITFLALNRGKKSLVLDLKSEGGGEVMKRLVEGADVLVHNFRPNTAERLGIGKHDIAAINPRTVYATVSGYGGAGPKGDDGGYDLMMQGESGIMEATGYADRPPAKAGYAVVDINAAANLAFGIVSSLLERERNGTARPVETSLYETAMSMGVILAERYLAYGAEPRRNGSASPLFSPYQAYKTRDGYFTVEGTGPPGAFERFCGAIDAPHLLDDPAFATNGDRVRNQHALAEAIEDRTTHHDTEYWINRMRDEGLPCGSILSIGEALDSEQTRALGIVVENRHPTDGTYRTVRSPLRIDGDPTVALTQPPRLGQHTKEVLASVGYGADSIQELLAAGVVLAEEVAYDDR